MSEIRLVISERAKAEIRRAAAWWERERPGARVGLLDELQQAFEILVQHPMAGRSVDGPRFQAVRRLSLNQTHYYLYYRLRDEDIVILGIRHQSREPGRAR